MENLREKLKRVIANNTVKGLDERYSIPEYFYDNLKDDLFKIATQDKIDLLVKMSNQNIVSFLQIEEVIIDLENQLNEK